MIIKNGTFLHSCQISFSLLYGYSIFPANVAAGSKDYSKVFHDLRNYSQYHVNTSMSPKFDVDFRLHNTTLNSWNGLEISHVTSQSVNL